MATFIRVHRASDKQPVLVNFDQVRSMTYAGDHSTRLSFGGDNDMPGLIVKEELGALAILLDVPNA